MDNILEIKNLTKIYTEGGQNINVLDNISFTAAKGEFIVFIGPSGSGKSTLLNLIALLDTPTAGEILFEGKEILHLQENKKAKLRLNKFGFVFQFDGLLPEFSVLENVNMPALIKGKNKNKRALELLENLGLAPLKDKMPPSISGGEKQRAAVARALINEPKLLLADEPTGNLDRERKIQIFKDFAALAKAGLTVLMVTHDMHAAAYADKCYKIANGKVEVFNPESKAD
ncbi:MAG: ABC transporter ATP-binding protein [Elusimicrobiota bacterium]|jgi:ABC-type lipoprotein export system ATPase subunit|nr:ABC transporter ATP-binding protein [Elusimicrobiota bacterium]